MNTTSDPAPEDQPTAKRSMLSAWITTPLGKASAILAVAATTIITLAATAWPPLIRLDRSVADHLHALALDHPGLTHANRILTDWVVDPWTMRALLAATVLGLWWQRRRALALCLTLASAAETAVRQVLRWALGRERPSWERPVDSADFAALPSGHAMTTAATCVLMLWLAHRSGLRPLWWNAALTIAVLAVAVACFTRVFLGVHWLTDTLAGTLLGGALATAALAALPASLRRRPSQGEGAAGPVGRPGQNLLRQLPSGYRKTTSDTDI